MPMCQMIIQMAIWQMPNQMVIQMTICQMTIQMAIWRMGGSGAGREEGRSGSGWGRERLGKGEAKWPFG